VVAFIAIEPAMGNTLSACRVITHRSKKTSAERRNQFLIGDKLANCSGK
jgi:hypothetical protein